MARSRGPQTRSLSAPFPAAPPLPSSPAPTTAHVPLPLPQSAATPHGMASSSLPPKGVGQPLHSSSTPIYHSLSSPAINSSFNATIAGVHGDRGVHIISTSNQCHPSQLDRMYHLGTRDNPNFLIVPKLLTRQENFQSWKRAVSISIAAKNKTPFIDGSLSRPPPSDPNFNSWVQCNNIVMAWLLQSVSQEIAAIIMFQDSARYMWHDLHERFNQGNGPRIFQLQTSVHSIKQGDSDVNTYFTRLKALWDELKEFQPIVPCSCGYTCGVIERLLGYYTRDQILQFLIGLNDSYNPIRAQILLYDPLPPLSRCSL
ncbi:uncharacterized protein LOC133799845 [Humulus lupulus]|uniref:uncharacterized protein LOC133799845 n=1 Tax=Humulus lupulus TaxID=3486 RepID=UPI002B406815|nr:uncharacterized protein LOC133799845 [Humulus lupulus]